MLELTLPRGEDEVVDADVHPEPSLDVHRPIHERTILETVFDEAGPQGYAYLEGGTRHKDQSSGKDHHRFFKLSQFLKLYL